MSSLKNAFVMSTMLAAGASVSAQNIDFPQQNSEIIPQQYINASEQSITDSTNISLYLLVSDTAHVVGVDTVIADDYIDTNVMKKNTMPTYEDPRKNSFIDLLKNGGLTEGIYKYRSDVYVEVKFKMEGKNSRIVVKMHQFLQDDPFTSYLLKDRFILDGYGHYLPRNPYPSDEARSFQSFLVSTPLSYVGPNLPVVPSL